jgi:hypothetical protein
MFHLKVDQSVPYDIRGLVPRPTGPQSLQDSYRIDVGEDRAGVFEVKAQTGEGTKLTSWSPGLVLLRPAGYTKLERLTHTGWQTMKNTSVATPGLYRWVR